MFGRFPGKKENSTVGRTGDILLVATRFPIGVTTWESDLCLRNRVVLVSERLVHIVFHFLEGLANKVSDTQQALGLRKHVQQNLDMDHDHRVLRGDLDAVVEALAQWHHQDPSCDCP